MARYGPRGALLVLDLDHFKYVNDALGHHAGDELILSVAATLRGRLRESDVLARLGGDEFAVLLPNVDERGAQRVAAELVRAIRDEAAVGSATKRRRRVTTSVGVAPFRAGDIDAARSCSSPPTSRCTTRRRPAAIASPSSHATPRGPTACGRA